jgi:tetratricopeptide (TPR) repeat protein
MDHSLHVRLLGPVDVVVDDATQPISGLRRKAVLAVLGLHPGLMVSAEIGEAHSRLSLAWVEERTGRFDEALRHAELALEAYRSQGNRSGEAYALNTAGWCHGLLGDYPTALAYCERALAQFHELGDRPGEARTLDSLGYLHFQLGNRAEAVSCYRKAIQMYRDLGDYYNEADAYVNLGDGYDRAGDRESAREVWQLALTILERLDHPTAAAVRAKLESAAGPSSRPEAVR